VPAWAHPTHADTDGNFSPTLVDEKIIAGPRPAVSGQNPHNTGDNTMNVIARGPAAAPGKGPPVFM
jgi:hypothetical protein